MVTVSQNLLDLGFDARGMGLVRRIMNAVVTIVSLRAVRTFLSVRDTMGAVVVMVLLRTC